MNNRFRCLRRVNRGPILSYVYMFLFSLRFQEAFWVIYLRSRGLSFAMIGLLETIFHLAALFGEIPTGWIADRFGRKTSLLAGRVLAAVSAYLALQASSPAGFAVAFALSALGFTFHSGAYEAMLYDELKDAGREAAFTRVMGAVNGIYLAGASLACFLGGLAAQRSLPLLYILNIAVDVLAVVLLIPLRERRRGPEEGKEPAGRIDPIGELRKVAAVLRQPGLGGLVLFWAFVSALVTSFWFYGQSYLRESRIPLTVIGLTGMLGNLAAVIPSGLAHRLERRHGSRRPLYLGGILVPAIMLLAGLIPAGTGAAQRVMLVGLILAVNIVAEGLYPIFTNAVNAMIPSERRATVLSAGSMLFSLVMMGVFPLIGFCGDALGLARGFVLVGGCGLLAAVGVYIFTSHRPGFRK